MAAPIYFATMLLPVVAIAAPKNGVCGIGTLIDVQAHVEVIQAGTIEHSRETVKKNGRKEYDSYSTSNLQKQTTYTVTIVLDAQYVSPVFLAVRSLQGKRASPNACTDGIVDYK